MKDLIVSATTKEIQPFLDHLKITAKPSPGDIISGDKLDILICGVGSVAATYNTATQLSKNKYKLIMNFGIAGSFSESIPVRSLVLIKEEIFSDLGAENADYEFLDIFEMNLIGANEAPFSDKMLRQDLSKLPEFTNKMKAVRSVTVNRVLSHEKSIDWVKTKFSPEIVSMEGAAIFYSAIMHSTPCLQIRAISDFVGKRDKTSWDIKGAIEELNKEMVKIYDWRNNIS